ncbi:MAG: LuxR C-terminal-related transcriptional regulator [Eubacteriales bacterium]|nr:LuxR C-terminal-related transcriptional regulator [Eubacteriales bacterium]
MALIREIMFTIDEDPCFTSSFILTQASTGYLKLKNWDSRVIGMEIDILFNSRFVEFFHEIRDVITNSGESLIFIKEIEGSFWKLEVNQVSKSIIFFGTVINNASELRDYYLSSELDYMDFYLKQKHYKDSVLIKNTENGFIVDSIGIEIEKATGLSPGRSISEAFGYFNCLESTEILQSCLRENITIRHLDTFRRGGIKKRVVLELIPLCHNNKYILISCYAIEDELFYRLIKNRVGITSKDFNYFAFLHVAVYGYIESIKKFTVIKRNINFACLAEKNDLNEIITHELLEPCLRQHFLISRIIELGGVSYIAVALPSVESNDYLVFLVKYDKMNQIIEECFSSLTPREREITELIIEGCSTKRIAIELHIAEGTVKKTTSNIYKKLGVYSRVGLMQYVFGK